MPMPPGFRTRLLPMLEDVANQFATPFHIYDEAGIRDTVQGLNAAFSGVPWFREYFAVKALPNPRILGIMKDLGLGFDCSSIAELVLARRAGARGEDILFTSNNTSQDEFAAAAADGGCILNLDDVSLLAKVPRLPELVCFRYNPGAARRGNAIIGAPEQAKFGVADSQILDAFRAAQARGARRFGLHCMLASNERDADALVQTVAMLLELAEAMGRALDIRLDFINMGGGLGIPYRPGDTRFDVPKLGRETARLLAGFGARNAYQPRVFMESGRYVTGPSGVLVTRAINRKDTYRSYVGVDACMSALMRPGMYGAYHHVEVLGKPAGPDDRPVDVVGSLCENNDKFAEQRPLPPIADGDLLLIHDTGAHGHAMGFDYNGRLRPKELLLRGDGRVELIRRAQSLDDYFATLDFPPRVVAPQRRGTPSVRGAADDATAASRRTLTGTPRG
ncbi:MAG: diaminopimelate decarboxylase [Ottowia sp.]|nr:diaminopimelate decarboxylase [Ottowia sp.]